MIPARFLQGVDADDADIPGIFGIRHARIPGSWRILCSYADGKRHKARLFARMAGAGQRERTKTWDLHHVVEGQHYAEIDFRKRLESLYHNELPCVLIAKEEHVAYNRLLHSSETDELFRDAGLPRKMKERSAATAIAAKDRNKHDELRARVRALEDLYRNAYSGDRVLQTIAANVLRDALAQLAAVR